MDTRVTLQAVIQSTLASTRRLTNDLATLQTQAATGKRFQRVSDDPAAYLSILANEAQAHSFSTHLENISSATSTLNMGVSTLQQVSELFTRARALAVEASSSVHDADSFASMATQVDAMLDQLLHLANTQSNDRFLFSGTASRTAPFVVARKDAQGLPLEVRYDGAREATSLIVERGQSVAIDYAGEAIFRGGRRQATTITGQTGARPGSGTDSATGRGKLLVTHTATSFAAGSGVLVGVDSPGGDTILGPLGRHRLHITDTSGTGAAGTVSLDGGATVAFTSADTNLRVTSSTGDVIYLNTTAITAGFDGDVDVAASGSLSIDDGATSVPITFAADQSVTDGVTGKVTFIDSSNVARTGRDFVDYPGTYDAFQALMALRDDLRNTRQLSEADQIEAISSRLGELERVHDQVLNSLGEQSASLQSLQSLESHLTDLQLNARTTSSELGAADLSEVVVNLQAYENMLQLTLATFARTVDQNLLEFLR